MLRNMKAATMTNIFKPISRHSQHFDDMMSDAHGTGGLASQVVQHLHAIEQIVN